MTQKRKYAEKQSFRKYINITVVGRNKPGYEVLIIITHGYHISTESRHILCFHICSMILPGASRPCHVSIRYYCPLVFFSDPVIFLLMLKSIVLSYFCGNLPSSAACCLTPSHIMNRNFTEILKMSSFYFQI